MVLLAIFVFCNFKIGNNPQNFNKYQASFLVCILFLIREREREILLYPLTLTSSHSTLCIALFFRENLLRSTLNSGITKSPFNTSQRLQSHQEWLKFIRRDRVGEISLYFACYCVNSILTWKEYSHIDQIECILFLTHRFDFHFHEV